MRVTGPVRPGAVRHVGHLMLPVVVYGINLVVLGTLLALQIRYLEAHPPLAAPDLTPIRRRRPKPE